MRLEIEVSCASAIFVRTTFWSLSMRVSHIVTKFARGLAPRRAYNLPYRIALYSSMGTDQSTLLDRDYPVAQSNCRIVVVGAKSGDTCLLALSSLPPEARIIATGNNLAEIKKDGDLYSEVSSVYVTSALGTRNTVTLCNSCVLVLLGKCFA